MKSIDKQMGIKYKVFKLVKDKFILFPIDVVQGFKTENGFQTNNELVKCNGSKKDLKNKFVIDYIFETNELNYIYDTANFEDEEFLKEYFFDDFKNTVIFTVVEEDGTLKKTMIDLDSIFDQKITYFMEENIPSLALNDSAINEVLKSNDLEEVKLNLARLRNLLTSFKKIHKSSGVTKLDITNGHVSYIEIGKENEINSEEVKYKEEKDESISYTGLNDYIKKRIFGHDDEIDIFSQKL